MSFVESQTMLASVEQIEDASWFATLGGADGCWGHGATEMEALDDLCETYREWVALDTSAGDEATQ